MRKDSVASAAGSFIIIIQMKTGLLITALLICVPSAGAFALDLSVEASADPPRRTVAVSERTVAPLAEIKAFFHPETGEILTYEQWLALGMESNEAAAASRSFSVSEPEKDRAVLQGRKVDLGNGDYVIVVDAPDSRRAETRAWFDDEGKAHITCGH